MKIKFPEFLKLKKNSFEQNETLIFVLTAIFFSVGIFGHIYNLTFPWMIFLTPLVLLIFGTLSLTGIFIEKNSRILIWALITYLFTFSAEALGVATGHVFGAYHYGATLGPAIFGVPLVIGFNWVLVVLGAITLMKRFFKNQLAIVVLSAVLTTVFDFFMEPVAMSAELDYWTWHQGFVPIQNYLAWFVLSLLASTLFVLFKAETKSKLLYRYMAIQFVFFILLQIGLKLSWI